MRQPEASSTTSPPATTTGDGRRRPPTASGRRRFRAEPLLYALFAAACTLAVALAFYSYMRLQTHYVQMGGRDFAAEIHAQGPWSAPLDDVFIHFDFARSAARGYPFQWSEGNGYSSGGTSLLYPLVLAFGYWAGFRQLLLMLWAAVVACVCVFALLLASRRMFSGLPRWTSYLAPLAVLCVGALDWTLFSGMEVALFLALWGGALIAWDDLVGSAGDVTSRRPWLGGLVLGLWGAALVATRPEGCVAVAALSLGAAIAILRRKGRGAAFRVLLASALPGVLVLAAQTIANKLLTGDAAAAGSLVKLELDHPYMTAHQVWEAWLFHAKYQVLRATNYHFSDAPGYGWIIWALALVPLFPRATRRYAILLWSSATLWVLLVALNGQVRWQNERYTMPAVAWLLLAAGLGVGVLLSHKWALGRRGRVLRASSIATALIAVSLFAYHQKKRFRDQIWFFGRASRNILEQHIRTGALIAHVIKPTPHRILVSDAGAIPYEADLPALDLIGLGGYHKLPFARATREGVGAAVELIERMPPDQRPDLIATYPSWWGNFVLWFGDRIAEVPVRGNVICGGPAQVIYRPDWTPLAGSATPSKLAPGEHVVDELDVADIVNEKQHGYTLSKKDVGFVHMKILPDPRKPSKPLWDAGRSVGGIAQSFTLRGFAAGRAVRLLFRVAPAEPAQFAVVVDGKRVGVVHLRPRDTWQEPALAIPAGSVRPTLHIQLQPVQGEYILYHLWAVQGQ